MKKFLVLLLSLISNLYAGGCCTKVLLDTPRPPLAKKVAALPFTIQLLFTHLERKNYRELLVTLSLEPDVDVTLPGLFGRQLIDNAIDNLWDLLFTIEKNKNNYINQKRAELALNDPKLLAVFNYEKSWIDSELTPQIKNLLIIIEALWTRSGAYIKEVTVHHKEILDQELTRLFSGDSWKRLIFASDYLGNPFLTTP